MVRILCVSLAVLSLAGPAAAQVNALRDDNPRENARLKLGPFYLTPRVQLEDLGVDTNVFNEGGKGQRDFFFTVTPSSRIWLPVAQRGLVFGTVGTDLVWYRENSSERSVDPEFAVRGEAYFRRFTLFGGGSLLSSRQRPNMEIDLRSRRREAATHAGIDLRITPKMTLGVTANRSRAMFDGDARFLGTVLERTMNRNSTGVTTEAKYLWTPLTTMAVRAERFEDRFPLSVERGTDNVRVMGGLEFKPRALINGSAFVGVRHLNPVDEALLPEFKGLVSDVSLSYTLLGATTFGVSHSRDIGYSFEPTQPYFLDTSVGGAIRRALGPHFDVVMSVDRTTYAYRNLNLLTAGEADSLVAQQERIDTTWHYSGSIGYRIGRSGRIGVGVSFWRRDSSTHADRAFKGFRLRTTATYGL